MPPLTLLTNSNKERWNYRSGCIIISICNQAEISIVFIFWYFISALSSPFYCYIIFSNLISSSKRRYCISFKVRASKRTIPVIPLISNGIRCISFSIVISIGLNSYFFTWSCIYCRKRISNIRLRSRMSNTTNVTFSA
jgi:hypothetical protein